MTARRKQSPYSRRKNSPLKWMRPLSIVLTLVLIACFYLFAETTKTHKESEVYETSKASTVATLDQQLYFVKLPAGQAEILRSYTGFEVSFNPEKHVPNYVSWELTCSETDGPYSRQNVSFGEDPAVDGCATLQDYRRSGFDRGHMAPAADMKWSEQAMDDCHYLTNIAPQDHALNAGRWNSLEQKCRNIAKQDSSVLIIAGPILTDRLRRTIGETQVVVPERFFKVLYTPFTNPPRAIAFVMPNRATSDPLTSLVMTVDQLEEITGMDFFSVLPDSIENEIESRIEPRKWEIY